MRTSNKLFLLLSSAWILTSCVIGPTESSSSLTSQSASNSNAISTTNGSTSSYLTSVSSQITSSISTSSTLSSISSSSSSIASISSSVSSISSSSSYSSIDWFQVFNQTLTSYTPQNTNGFYYLMQQKVGSTVVNEDQMNQRIVWTPQVKSFTELITKRINLYGEQEPYSITESVIYFANNQIGYQEGTGSVQWVNASLSDYLDQSLDQMVLDSNDLVSSMVNFGNATITLTATVKKSASITLFQVPWDEVENNEIRIVIDFQTFQLIAVQLTYQQTYSSTTIDFIPFYGIADVIIP